MSNLLEELMIVLGLDTSRVRSGVTETEAQMHKVEGATEHASTAGKEHTGLLGRAIESLGPVAEIAGGIITAQLGGSIVEWGLDSVKVAGEASAAMAQTAAVLQSTGGAANVTSQQLTGLIKNLSDMSAVSQMQVRANENMLLTFTGVKNEVGAGNDIFNQASVTVLNMSRALGEDGKSAAIQLGKALNDPISGVTALRRVGVQLTDAQKEQIKTLMQHNDQLGAQKIILGELNREFGNSAQAYADSAAGGMAKFTNSLEEVQIAIGNQVIPLLGNLLGAISPVMDGVKDWVNNNQNLIAQLGVMAGQKMTDLINEISNLATQVGPPLKDVLDSAKDAAAALFSAFTGGKKPIDDINQVVPLVTGGLKDLKDILDGVKDHANQLVPAIEAVVVGMVAWQIATTAMTVGGIIAGLITYLVELVTQFTIAASAEGVLTAAQWLLNIAMDANPIGLIIVGIGALITVIVLLVANWDTVKAKALELWALLPKIWEDIKTGVQKAINGMVQWAQQELPKLPGQLGYALGSMVGLLIHFYLVDIPNWETGIIRALGELIPKWIDWIQKNGPTLIQNFVDFMNQLPLKMVSIGVAIVQGIWSGITSMNDWLNKQLEGFVSGFVQGIKDHAQISSPSRLMAAQVGVPLAQGVAMGILSDRSAVAAMNRHIDALTSGTGEAALGGLNGRIGQLALAGASVPDGRTGPTINLTVHNPTPEPASTTTLRQLRLLAATGRLG